MSLAPAVQPPFGQQQVQLILPPVGSILPYAGPLDDAATKGNLQMLGWLPCDGTEVPRAQYPELYTAIGNAWGEPFQDTYFVLPDLRGLFLRGVNGTRSPSLDPDSGSRTGSGPNGSGNAGNQVASFQQQQLQEHEHTYTPATVTATAQAGSGVTAVVATPQATTQSVVCEAGTEGSTECFGVETRPVNVYVNFILKAVPDRVVMTVPAVEIPSLVLPRLGR